MRPSAPIDVVVVGPIVQDVVLRVEAVPAADGSVTAVDSVIAAGGKGANPAVAAARLGANVRLIGAVGEDQTGRAVLDQLRGDGIDVDLVHGHDRAQTGRIVHLVEPGGRRRYIEHVGANGCLRLSEDEMRRRCSAETVALISTALGSQPAAAAARGARLAGAFVVVDLAGEPATAASVLDSADLVRGDSSEISVLVDVDVRDFATAARAAELLLARGPQIAVVQAGDQGDLVLTPRQAVRLRRLPVTVVDPTGAGDAFVASLAVLLASGVELQTAAELAAAAAAHTVSHLSGRPAYAGLPELMAIRETGHVS